VVAGQVKQESAVRDNAISAVLKICRYRSEAVDTSQLLPSVLTWLPLTADVTEAQTCHGDLVGWAESGDPALLGPDGQNLIALVTVLLKLLGKRTRPNRSDDGLRRESEAGLT
jgi:hypothetical protein